MATLTRRRFLRLLAASAGAIALAGAAGCQIGVQQVFSTPTPRSSPPIASSSQLGELIVKGTPGPLTIPLARATQSEQLRALVKQVTFSTWKTPDQLRADITSGKLHIATGTSNVAANLYRRGVGVQLFSVTLVQGMFSVMTLDQGINGWGDLKGRKLALAYRGDMPDLIFRILAKANGLNPDADFQMQYTSTPAETMQVLLAQRVEVAMVAEPQSTAAEVQESGLTVRRIINLTDEWGKLDGTSPRVPMAGTLVVASIANSSPNVVVAMEKALIEATTWTNQNPAEAAKIGAERLGLEAPVLEKSLAHLRLEAQSAVEARQELESFLSRLKELSPDIIGGDLPDDGFYFKGR